VSWAKEKLKFKAKKCRRKDCEACRDFRVMLFATEARMEVWLLNDVWDRLHRGIR
jgi:hypothetical protein